MVMECGDHGPSVPRRGLPAHYVCSRLICVGEDPLDAEEERERASRGHNPFGGGFNPFGGGQRFNFKFQ